MSISQLLFVYNYLFFLDANGSCPCMVCGGTLTVSSTSGLIFNPTVTQRRKSWPQILDLKEFYFLQDLPWLEFWQGQKSFSSQKCPDQLWGLPILIFCMYQGLLPGGKAGRT